jgi:hypothetical protein
MTPLTEDLVRREVGKLLRVDVQGLANRCASECRPECRCPGPECRWECRCPEPECRPQRNDTHPALRDTAVMPRKIAPKTAKAAQAAHRDDCACPRCRYRLRAQAAKLGLSNLWAGLFDAALA